jgi:hypothetical protein
VARRTRVADEIRPNLDRGGSPHGRPATLEFVHRQVDAVVQESAERALDAVLADESRDIFQVAAGQLEKPAVRARGTPIDMPSDERQEVRLPRLQATADDAPGFGHGERTA